MSRSRNTRYIRRNWSFWQWLQTTPGWWVRLTMTRPQRRQAAVWQRNAEKTPPNNLDQVNKPPQGRKPHHYFW